MHLLKRFVIMMIFITVAGAAADARACRLLDTKKDTFQTQFVDRAYYVGLVKVIKVSKPWWKPIGMTSTAGKPEVKYDLKPVKSYTAPISKFHEIAVYDWNTDCNFAPKFEIGSIYETIIFKRDDGFFEQKVNFGRNSRQFLMELEEGSEDSRSYEALANECGNKGGELKKYSYAYIDSVTGITCQFSTLDANKNCGDSSDCEALCAANLELNDFNVAAVKEVRGQCIGWKPAKGCFYEVQNGEVYKDKKCFN